MQKSRYSQNSTKKSECKIFICEIFYYQISINLQMSQSRKKCCRLFNYPHIHFSYENSTSDLNQPSVEANFNNFLNLNSDEQHRYFIQPQIIFQQSEEELQNIANKQRQNKIIQTAPQRQMVHENYVQEQRLNMNVQTNERRNKKKKIAKYQRKDIDGQNAFKQGNYGIRNLCRQYQYKNIIDFDGRDSQKSKDYIVLLCCQIQASLLKEKPQLCDQIPELCEEMIKPKVKKAQYKYQIAKSEKQRIHAEHTLLVYENTKRVLEAYFIQKDPQQAMILAYGPKIKYDNRLNDAILKMRALRKSLGLNQYIVESQVNLT